MRKHPCKGTYPAKTHGVKLVQGLAERNIYVRSLHNNSTNFTIYYIVPNLNYKLVLSKFF